MPHTTLNLFCYAQQGCQHVNVNYQSFANNIVNAICNGDGCKPDVSFKVMPNVQFNQTYGGIKTQDVSNINLTCIGKNACDLGVFVFMSENSRINCLGPSVL